jgi:hypothetical protein
LTIPAYTVLKNGAIILTVRRLDRLSSAGSPRSELTYAPLVTCTSLMQAYGEVIWFGGHVTSLALASFGLIVSST